MTSGVGRNDRVSIVVVNRPPDHSPDPSSTLRIVAAGGWYVMPEERDLPSAYYRALESGLGIVVPVRDHDGRLIISAGPANGYATSFDEFLAERPVWPGRPSVMAIKICSDGLASLVRRSLLQAAGIAPYVFGMSVPDMPSWLDGNVPLFVRQSEHEPAPAFYEFAEGVWLDSFERDWYDERLLIQHLRAGKHVAVVSPEMHDRPHDELWGRLKALQDQLGELAGRVQLCTSRPQEARSFFTA